MQSKRFLTGLVMGLVALSATLDAKDNRSIIEKYQPSGTQIYNIARYNRTHRKGNIWLTITNWGFFGNLGLGDSDAMYDPEYPGTWAPQCEYPGNSDVQYLFMGAVWLGALVQEGGFEFPRVSVGSEGWTGPGNNNYEFEPGEVGGSPPEEHGIRERSTIPNSYNRLGDYVTDSSAIAEQDFVAVYSDTLAQEFWTGRDIIDGPHFPLGVRVKQTSYSWSYNYAQEFILIDYEFENIASNFLKNLYIALYVDADVGWLGEGTWHEDDICGFQQWYYYQRRLPDGSMVPDSTVINVAYIADNDGRPQTVNSGTEFTCPAVTGVRVVRAPNPRLVTSFNWWISNGNADLDFGPAWEDDGALGNWTNIYGTPDGDARKYFVMSNGEFDYDQIRVNNSTWVSDHEQVVNGVPHEWKQADITYGTTLANGYDTRYLLSWGPLGIFDHQDPSGKDIYRLNPGEKFHMTIGYVAGANFHQTSNAQGDLTNSAPDYAKFNFAPLQYNAAWCARVFDNEMVDTKTHHPNDSILVNNKYTHWYGDGWFGEDVGTDGLFAANINDSVTYFGTYYGLYPGPDPDGTEKDGKLQPNEDQIPRDEFIVDPRYGDLDLGYTKNNGILDPGDGIPDFKGPPPPQIPDTVAIPQSGNKVVLKWKNNAEDPSYADPFSGAQDFEGYRIYVSNTGLEMDYQLLAEFDKIDFAYYSASDSLASYPTNQTNLPATKDTLGMTLYLKPVGSNLGLPPLNSSDSTYTFDILDAHPGYPRYYSITSFDFGDPKSGTQPLETARNANAMLLAPSGSPNDKVMVVPNPYRAYLDYTQVYVPTGQGEAGLSWENQYDGTPEYFPQTDRRIDFINLPAQCLIRIYTVAGDLVQIIPHTQEMAPNPLGDPNDGWVSDYSESWDLNSRNSQQVVSGLYLFSVEDMTEGNKGKIEVGKFVIIR